MSKLTRRATAAAAALAALAATAMPAMVRTAQATASEAPETDITHVVVIVQENHSFDQYFAAYCRQAGTDCNNTPAYANPYEPLTPVATSDATTMAYDPNHDQECELHEMDGGKMDQYTTPDPVASYDTGYLCGSPSNFAEAPADATSPVAQYHDWAAHSGSLADNYFQPVAGASSSNDMYFWTTHFVFKDNDVEPKANGKQCSTNMNVAQYPDATNENLGHVLDSADVSWAWYAEGYDDMTTASASAIPPGCPVPPVDCGAHVPSYPCVFDPSDIPSEYYASSADNPVHMKDYTKLSADIAAGTLPSVSFVKAIGYRSEHPGYGTKLSDGVAFVKRTVDAIENNPTLKDNTLVLVAWDESGGYWDHVAPPASVENYADGSPVPYGPRVPFLALGTFAATGTVSHVQLEHSSVTKFIEWNWLHHTGQLGGRDASAAVHNLGSMLDPNLEVPN